MGISFNFDGDAIERAVWRQTKQLIEQRVRAVVCGKHGKHARVVWTRGGGSRIPRSNAEFEIRGCCEELAKRARNAVPDQR